MDSVDIDKFYDGKLNKFTFNFRLERSNQYFSSINTLSNTLFNQVKYRNLIDV